MKTHPCDSPSHGGTVMVGGSKRKSALIGALSHFESPVCLEFLFVWSSSDDVTVALGRHEQSLSRGLLGCFSLLLVFETDQSRSQASRFSFEVTQEVEAAAADFTARNYLDTVENRA
jgi:hypothetical protein